MQPGDGAFGHVDTELEKLTMNSRGAPEKVCGGHARDQGPNLVVDARAAGGAAGKLGPSTRGNGAAATAGRCRESRSPGAGSTRPRLWPARPRKRRSVLRSRGRVTVRL